MAASSGHEEEGVQEALGIWADTANPQLRNSR